jgi:hypothetical protein
MPLALSVSDQGLACFSIEVQAGKLFQGSGLPEVKFSKCTQDTPLHSISLAELFSEIK